MADKLTPNSASLEECSQTLLAALIRQTMDLLTVLQREHAALKAHEIQNIVKIAKHKRTLVADLEKITMEHKRLFELLQDNMTTVVDRGAFPEADLDSLRAGDLWKELRTIASACHQQNKANGELLMILNRHTENILRILRHRAAAAGNELYDSCGRAHSVMVPSDSTMA